MRHRVLLGRRHPTPAEVAVSESTPKTGHIRVLLVWPCGSPTYGAGRKSSSNLVQPNQLHEITCGYRKEYYIESGFLLRGTLPQGTHGGQGGGTPQPSPAGLCPHCRKQCRGARCLAVHTRAAHPESYHSERTAAIGTAIAAQVKSRWDSEESAIMAQEEARLRSLRVKFLNQGLLQYMPQRTLEAIKGHRRRPDYKSLVEMYKVSTPWGHDSSQAEEMAERYPPSNTADPAPAVVSPNTSDSCH